jgi:ankyrin repeat protein
MAVRAVAAKQNSLDKEYLDECDRILFPDIEKIKHLLEAKANPFARNAGGENALHLAAFHRSKDLCSFLIEQYSDLMTMRADTQYLPSHTSLYLARKKGFHACLSIIRWYTKNKMQFPFESETLHGSTHFHLLAGIKDPVVIAERDDQTIRKLAPAIFCFLDSQIAQVREAVALFLPVRDLTNLVDGYVGDKNTILQMKDVNEETAAEIATRRGLKEDVVALFRPHVKEAASEPTEL